MKRIKLFFTISLMVLALVGCSKWDKEIDNLKDRVSQLEETVKQLNSSLEQVKTIINALESGDYITGIEELEDGSGYKITFAKGGTITIKNGKDGKDAPIIGIKEGEDGIWYWTITTDGKEEFLEIDGQRIPVSGKDGVTPVIGVNKDGYWTIDMKDGRGPQIMTDSEGNPIKAEGKDGDSFFSDIDNSSDDYVVITLSNGSVITLPKVISELSFSNEETEITFSSSETKELKLIIDNISYAELLSVPQGWAATLQDDVVTVTAPDYKNGGATSGILSVIGIDSKGNSHIASRKVTLLSVDYTDPEGTFIVVEGNMTSENGTIAYIDKNGNLYENIYEDANDGEEIGNVVQDIYIHNGKLYIISQNGNSMGGAGRFIVCDLKTMKKEKAIQMDFYREGTLCWPQHIVVADNGKAYIQHSTSDMEQYSGIRVIDLNSLTVADSDLPNTSGAFTTEGATKARMVMSRGKIFAGRGNSVVIINPANDDVKVIPMNTDCSEGYTRQVKNIAKGYDGYIYAVVSGSFTGSFYSPEWGSDAKVVKIDHDGNICQEFVLEGLHLPVATWSPSVNLCASFTEPLLFFTSSEGFSTNEACSFNFENGTVNPFINLNEGIYGYMGAHPTNGKIYVGSSPTFMSSKVFIYDSSAGGNYSSSIEIKKASPAGIDFAYRFTDEWINR